MTLILMIFNYNRFYKKTWQGYLHTFYIERNATLKKKTLPKTLKQKAVSLFKNEKEEYAYYLKEYKEKFLPSEFKQPQLLD